jgi:signal transduction histidine kinase/tetratricopeptide (TPR) repeat protein
MADKQLVATGRRFALALRRQRKVLLLFLVTILLPAAVLSVFGLRALEADRYRMERLMRREQEEALRAFRGRLAARFDEIGGALERLRAKGSRSRTELRREVLRGIGARELPETVVAVSDSGEFFYVREGFVTLAPDRADAATESVELMEAQRLEHSRGREAASRYARLAKSEAPEVRLPALNSLGRTLIRLGALEKAIAAYRELLRDQPEILTAETAVLPLIAGLQIAFCYEKLGESHRALPDLVTAYGEMVERKWIVASETLAFYSSEYEKLIEGVCSPGRSDHPCSAYRSLAARKSARVAKVRELEALRRDLPPLLVRSRSGSDESRKVLRLPGSTVVAAGFSEGLTFAAVIGDPALLAVVTGREGANPARNDTVRVRVSNRGGQVIFRNADSAPGEVFLEERLGEGFPDWKVVLFHDPADVAHLTDLRKSIYAILTATLISALLLGAFLMARTVHHEMELIRIKSDFVSLVSHEFKTPIASMRALVDRLQAGHVPDGARMQRYFDIVSGELQRLTRLVNNVLDFSKIEEGRKVYSPQETDLAELVRELVATFEAGASAKGFAIETAIAPDIPKVRVDRDSVSQALLNLLDNAVKYSETEKRIGVDVQRNSHFVRISVADHGTGVGAHEVSKIFEKFYRSPEAAERGVPGLGLGLSLVEHVMSSHGGKVTVESQPGSGSTFTLSIPLDAPVGSSESSRES